MGACVLFVDAFCVCGCFLRVRWCGIATSERGCEIERERERERERAIGCACVRAGARA